MSEIELKDMLKEIRAKLDSIAKDVEVLVKNSEHRKISNTFDKVFKNGEGN